VLVSCRNPRGNMILARKWNFMSPSCWSVWKILSSRISMRCQYGSWDPSCRGIWTKVKHDIRGPFEGFPSESSDSSFNRCTFLKLSLRIESSINNQWCSCSLVKSSNLSSILRVVIFKNMDYWSFLWEFLSFKFLCWCSKESTRR
jgi:hypothetical protein